MLRVIAFCLAATATSMLLGGNTETIQDDSTQWDIIRLTQGNTVVLVAPQAGANAYSIKIDGVEQFRQPESLKKLPGAGFGNPVLYPTPNRVRNAHFQFQGKSVSFKPNAGKNFIHGLVNRRPWRVIGLSTTNDSAKLVCEISFAEGTELHKLFPFHHKLQMSITVADRSVKWGYEVIADGDDAIPFGFALHPYFLYQGERANTFLTIPATHMMQSVERLPTGKLLSQDGIDLPLGQPITLAGKKLDDVFLGMKPDQPTLIEHRDMRESIQISASTEFTHLVVWTPDRPYFGVESQTCSTDAHNMHGRGFESQSHLQICEPGHTMSGWVKYTFLSAKK